MMQSHGKEVDRAPVVTYVLPRDPYLFLGKVLAIIPDDWCAIDGRLHAPESSVRANKVALGVGYRLEAEAFLYTEQVTDDPTFEVLHEMITTPRLPQYVLFVGAGLGGVVFALAKRIATDYLAQGFVGTLSFLGQSTEEIVINLGEPGKSHIAISDDGNAAPFKKLCREHRLKDFSS